MQIFNFFTEKNLNKFAFVILVFLYSMQYRIALNWIRTALIRFEIPNEITYGLPDANLKYSHDTSSEMSASDAGGMGFKSRADQVTNDSPPLQPWSVGPGAKLWRWAPLTRDTRKGIKRV